MIKCVKMEKRNEKRNVTSSVGTRAGSVFELRTTLKAISHQRFEIQNKTSRNYIKLSDRQSQALLISKLFVSLYLSLSASFLFRANEEEERCGYRNRGKYIFSIFSDLYIYIYI